MTVQITSMKMQK